MTTKETQWLSYLTVFNLKMRAPCVAGNFFVDDYEMIIFGMCSAGWEEVGGGVIRRFVF